MSLNLQNRVLQTLKQICWYESETSPYYKREHWRALQQIVQLGVTDKPDWQLRPMEKGDITPHTTWSVLIPAVLGSQTDAELEETVRGLAETMMAWEEEPPQANQPQPMKGADGQPKPEPGEGEPQAAGAELQDGHGEAQGGQPSQGGAQRADVDLGGEAKAEAAKEAERGRKAGEGAGQTANLTVPKGAVRWERILDEVMDRKRSRRTWKRRGRKAGWRTDIPMRGVIQARRRQAHVFVDVSGSVDMPGVKAMVGAIKGAPANYLLDVSLFNTDVHAWPDFRQTEMPVVGGGTSFDACLEELKGLRRFPDAIVMMTDGEAEVPVLPHSERWVWLIYGNDSKAWREANRAQLGNAVVLDLYGDLLPARASR